MNKSADTRLEVGGLYFDAISQQQARERIAEVIRHQKRTADSFVVVKPYVEFFVGAWKDPKVARILRNADLSLADGVAVQWAASYLAGKHGVWRLVRSLVYDVQRPDWRTKVIPERGAGVDATHALLLEAGRKGWRIGVIGGPRDTLSTQRALKKRYPGVDMRGVWTGYFTASQEAKLVDEIKSARLDLLFVAMGFPLQEQFIDRHKSDHLAKVLIGEGGTFDFDSMGGPLKRSPAWMRRLGLEWLWRLLQQPQRWRRQSAIFHFIAGIYRAGSQK